MNYKEFMGKAQHRLELDELGPAVRGTRAVLTTLGERIDPGEATDLASPLPMEVDRFVTEGATQTGGEPFSYDEFLDRVAERAGVDRPDANYYAETIVGLVSEIVPEGNIEALRAQLPEEYGSIFTFVEEEHPMAQ